MGAKLVAHVLHEILRNVVCTKQASMQARFSTREGLCPNKVIALHINNYYYSMRIN